MQNSSFFDYFNQIQLEEEIVVNSQLSLIPNWSFEKIKQVCCKYRGLVRNHSNHLALLVYRLPESRFKSLIAEILNDEQGNGKYERSHLFLWDNFLRSLGISNFNQKTVTDDPMLKLINNSSLDFVVGLEGLGVECICSVYLAVFEKYLRRHPYFLKNAKQLDWQFFDIHVRGEDIQHKEKIREAVIELIEKKEIDPNLVILGYNKAKEIWQHTWQEWALFAEKEKVKALL